MRVAFEVVVVLTFRRPTPAHRLAPGSSECLSSGVGISGVLGCVNLGIYSGY